MKRVLRLAAAFVVMADVLVCLAAELRSPYQAYRLKLTSFVPKPDRIGGALLPVRINASRPLRLLLDSGAQDIVLGRHAAEACRLEGSGEVELVGWGRSLAKTAVAERVDVGPVSFGATRVLIVEGAVLDGADGVLPLALFGDFLVRLDLPRLTLDLSPFAAGEPPTRSAEPLIVEGGLDGGLQGRLLVDTGAYRSAVQRSPDTRSEAQEISLQGAGNTTAHELRTAVRFRVGSTELVANQPLALDMGQRDIVGVIGFRDLSKHRLAIDYRSGKVEFDPQE